MTKINFNKTKTAFLAIATIVLVAILPLVSQGIPTQASAQNQPQANTMPPVPKLSADQQSKFINIAMNMPEIKQWSSSGWEYLETDWIGTQNPPQWTTAVIYLHLPLGKGNPPIQCTASNGSWASVAIDLGTYAIKGANYPKTGESYDCTRVHNSPVQSGTASPVQTSIAPQVLTFFPGFVIAQENDVATSNIFGSSASIFTPSFSTNIYNVMDENISVLLNQLWTTGAFTQLGWTITHVAGCAGSGINANSADIGWVDTTAGTSTCINNIPTFTYTAGTNMLAQTLCNGGSNYVEQITYQGTTFQRTTGITCSTHQTTDQDNNSVFFENQNTVASSNWSGDVTGTVQASNAREFVNSISNLQQWTTSNPHQVSCGGTQTNTVLSGSLASNGIAKWINLSTVPVGCFK